MRFIFLALGIAQVTWAVLALRRPRPEQSRWALTAVLLVSGLAWLWLGARDWLQPEAAPSAPGSAEAIERQLVDRGALLGRVEGGELRVLAPAGSAGGMVRLTEIGMAEAVAPESREIDLRPYEGTVLVVRGQDSGGWIYESEVVERGGPLLTALVQQVYRPAP
jgi:hypothetical protein